MVDNRTFGRTRLGHHHGRGFPVLAIYFAMLSAWAFGAENPAPVLLGGFDGQNVFAIQSTSVVGKVTVTLTRTGASSDIMQGSFQSTQTTWGTNALDVAVPPDAGNNSILQTGTLTPFTLIVTVTNTAFQNLNLSQIHYWLKKDIADEGPNSGTLTYTSGDLDDLAGVSNSFSIANGINPYDLPLSSLITDTVLAPGESAAFTWAHGTPQNPAGNTSIRIDNFAISGYLIPNPQGTVISLQ
jgi:hypothetical protein